MKKTKMATVREFSRCGPCIPLGRFIKRTPKRVFYLDDYGNVTCKTSRGHLVHTEPCPSCQDHPQTQYPNEYDD
jgi:hypothetical protein